MRRLGLERELVDATVYENTVVRFPGGRHRPPDVRPAGRPRPDPGQTSRAALKDVGPDDAHPLNLFRVHWYNNSTRRELVAVPEHMVLPVEMTGVDAPHRGRIRRPLPDDQRPQGAGGLRLPGAAGHHRAVRPDAPPRDLALHGQLLPRRRRHLAAHGLPRRRGAARGDEQGAVRLARPLGGRTEGRRDPHAGHGEQCQGDLRQVPRACGRSRERDLQPVCRVREPRRALPRTGAALVASSTRSSRRAVVATARLCLRDRLGRHDRRRRLPQGAVRLADRRGRGARVPDDALQRVRRAQHPGHRRQAHPADPQRDEHRRARRDLRPRHRPAWACCSTPRSAASTSPAARGAAADVVACRRSACRASATCSRPSTPRSTTGWAPTT